MASLTADIGRSLNFLMTGFLVAWPFNEITPALSRNQASGPVLWQVFRIGHHAGMISHEEREH